MKSFLEHMGKLLFYIIEAFNDYVDSALGYPPYEDSTARKNKTTDTEQQ